MRARPVVHGAAMRLAVLAVTLLLCACGTSAVPAAKPVGAARGIPVSVAAVGVQTIAYAVHATGTVAAFETVTIAAQVGGVIEQVAFREGQAVTTDTVLVEVDPRRYALRAEQSAAELAEAQAEQIEAAAGLRNREQLAASGDGRVTAEEMAAHRAKLAAAEARVAQRQALAALAELDRDRSRVRPPMAGEIQARLVQTGQQVVAGTAVATMLRRDPLLVRFTVSEEEGARLRPGLEVTVRCAGIDQPATAAITHVAAAVDALSRRIQVIADVAVADAARLRPGAFAEVVTLLESAERPAVPQTAIRPSERGFLAYVVVDGKAEERVLTLGLRSADGRVEVRSGLQAGEQVVVRGAEALRPGATVVIDGAP